MSSGKLFLIIGPSGVGKGTVINLFKKRYPENFVFPISVTTRLPRPGEKDGETYHFISKEEFQRKVENDEFLEWAVVHEEHFYGTLKGPTLAALAEGKNVLRELDIQGFESIWQRRNTLPTPFVSIFLLPPPLEVLKRRIQKRSPLSQEELEKRMQSMAAELSKSVKCDYQVQTIDGDIPGTFALVEEVVRKELQGGREEGKS